MKIKNPKFLEDLRHSWELNKTELAIIKEQVEYKWDSKEDLERLLGYMVGYQTKLPHPYFPIVLSLFNVSKARRIEIVFVSGDFEFFPNKKDGYKFYSVRDMAARVLRFYPNYKLIDVDVQQILNAYNPSVRRKKIIAKLLEEK